MHRYAQIDENGYIISDSHLSGIVENKFMIPIDDDFDLTNKKWHFESKTFVDYVPDIPTLLPTEQELLLANIATETAYTNCLAELNTSI